MLRYETHAENSINRIDSKIKTLPHANSFIFGQHDFFKFFSKYFWYDTCVKYYLEKVSSGTRVLHSSLVSCVLDKLPTK